MSRSATIASHARCWSGEREMRDQKLWYPGVVGRERTGIDRRGTDFPVRVPRSPTVIEKHLLKRLFVLLASVGAGVPMAAHAAGFALIEQSASGMGTAFAGAAAVAEDASTVWFNPAGMARLSGSQIAIAGHVIDVKSNLTNNGSTSPLGIGTLGGNGGNAGGMIFLPNFYGVFAIDDRVKLGLAINAPWGLSSEYDANWLGRFQAVKSEITSININPSVSVKVNDSVSLGFGINYSYVDVELTRKAVLGPGAEGNAKLSGNDYALGFNFGALFQVSAATRVGVAYRSSADYNLSGNQVVTTPSGLPVPGANFAIKAALTLPASASLSAVHELSDRWTLLGDVTFVQWSEIQQLQVKQAATGATSSTLALKLDDTVRVSLGATYRLCDAWKLRAGVAWDPSPVKDSTRTANLPDADRTWLALGARWQISKAGAVDLGYAHIFFQNSTIAHSLGTAAATGVIRGSYQTSADVLSFQYSHAF